MIKTPIDAMIVVTLNLIVFGLAFAFIRAKRPREWVATWFAFGVIFLGLEILGAQTANTLSDNIVASVPLYVLIPATLAVPLLLCAHWIDLATRRAVSYLRGIVERRTKSGGR
jgi:hypothetical protein